MESKQANRKFQAIEKSSVPELNNQYRQDYLLNKGGNGSVYKASKRKYYAMKIINEEYDKIDLTEINVMTQINSPYLNQICDFYKNEEGKLVIITKLASMGSLDQVLVQRQQNQQQNLNEGQIIEWFAMICMGLKALHSHNIMHRDIKPQNILVFSYSDVRLADFGSSKFLENTIQNAQTFTGTIDFMAPEVKSSFSSYDMSADIYSLGMTLYFIITQSLPTWEQIITKTLKIDSASQEINSLISSMLDLNPKNRPSIREILKLELISDTIAYKRNKYMQEYKRMKESCRSLNKYIEDKIKGVQNNIENNESFDLNQYRQKSLDASIVSLNTFFSKNEVIDYQLSQRYSEVSNAQTNLTKSDSLFSINSQQDQTPRPSASSNKNICSWLVNQTQRIINQDNQDVSIVKETIKMPYINSLLQNEKLNQKKLLKHLFQRSYFIVKQDLFDQLMMEKDEIYKIWKILWKVGVRYDNAKKQDYAKILQKKLGDFNYANFPIDKIVGLKEQELERFKKMSYPEKEQVIQQIQGIKQKIVKKKVTFPNGSQIQGYTDESKHLNDIVRLIFSNTGSIYFGELKNNSSNGYGMLIKSCISEYTNSFAYFESFFVNGSAKGFGKSVMSTGEFYFGDFVDGMRNGKGLFFFGNKAVDNKLKNLKYVGDFLNNRQTGKGVMFYNDGTIMKGIFLNEKPNGKIVFTDKKGQKHLQIYKNGELQESETQSINPQDFAQYMELTQEEIDENYYFNGQYTIN